MLHDHVWIFFLSPGHPSAPKSHLWGLTQVMSDMRTQIEFGMKIFEIDMETEI